MTRDTNIFGSLELENTSDEDSTFIYRPTNGYKKRPRLKRRYLLGAIIIILIVVLIVVAYCTDVFSKKDSTSEPPDPTEPLPASQSILYAFKKAAVCSDGLPCAEIGRNILEKNGSAIDATIAAMICNGVVTMQSMGLGGGFLMTIYKRDEKKAYFLNAREKAPLNVKAEMYKTDPKISRNGPLSVAVPGELKGYWMAYKRFGGKLPWKDLIEPTISLCEKGFNMSNHQYHSLFKTKLHDDPNFKEWFYDSDGEYKKPGSKIVPTRLCKTLRVIAENGGDDLYNGTLSNMLLQDIEEMGGIITREDLEQYESEWMEPISIQFKNGDNLYSSPHQVPEPF